MKIILAALVISAFLTTPVTAVVPASDDAGDVRLALTGPVFDGSGAARLDEGVVLVADDRIVCVGSTADCPVPQQAEHIVVTDGTILPGLIDLHVHARPHYLAWFLVAGVTTIRDANNALDQIRALHEASHRPRIVWTGPMLDGPNTVMRHFGDAGVLPPDAKQIDTAWTLLISNEDAARQAVDLLQSRGANFIKLYEQLDPQVYDAAAEYARQRGLRVMTDLGMHGTRGLSGAKVDALQAMAAGVHSIEHASGYALAYRNLGGDIGKLPYDQELIDRLAHATVEAGVALVPTLAVSYAFADDVAAIDNLPAAELLRGNEEMYAWYQSTADRRTEFNNDMSHRAHLLSEALTLRIHELGGVIGAGSDSPAGVWNVPGGGLHRELELLVRAGLSPVAALYAATGAAAQIIGADDIGALRSGAIADILVVAGDPTVDITATRTVRHVFKSGKAVDLTWPGNPPEK